MKKTNKIISFEGKPLKKILCVFLVSIVLYISFTSCAMSTKQLEEILSDSVYANYEGVGNYISLIAFRPDKTARFFFVNKATGKLASEKYSSTWRVEEDGSAPSGVKLYIGAGEFTYNEKEDSITDTENQRKYYRDEDYKAE